MVREGTQMQQAGTEACCQGNGYTSHGVLPWPFRQRRSVVAHRASYVRGEGVGGGKR